MINFNMNTPNFLKTLLVKWYNRTTVYNNESIIRLQTSKPKLSKSTFVPSKNTQFTKLNFDYFCQDFKRALMKYKRILLKLSGEALMGEQQYGIDPKRIREYAEDIKTVLDEGVEIAVVIGGGNIFRGLKGVGQGMDRVQGDHMGMLATVINALALQSGLESVGVETRVQSAIKINEVAEPFIRRRAIRHLEKGRVVIFGGGTGNPYFTTDSAAVLRAIEIKADVILKGTRVDGIYTADPKKDKTAQKFDLLSFEEVLNKGLKVMDTTAFTLSQENQLPIVVFDMNTKGNLMKIVTGENIGTTVVN